VSHTTRRWFIAALLAGTPMVLMGVAALVVYAGIYDIAADEPHSQPVFWVMQMVRDRSIAAHATDAVPVDLSEPKRIASGAVQYDEPSSRECFASPLLNFSNQLIQINVFHSRAGDSVDGRTDHAIAPEDLLARHGLRRRVVRYGVRWIRPDRITVDWDRSESQCTSPSSRE